MPVFFFDSVSLVFTFTVYKHKD